MQSVIVRNVDAGPDIDAIAAECHANPQASALCDGLRGNCERREDQYRATGCTGDDIGPRNLHS